MLLSRMIKKNPRNDNDITNSKLLRLIKLLILKDTNIKYLPCFFLLSEEENLVNVYKEKDSPLLQEIKPILTINLFGAVCKKVLNSSF